MIRRAHASVALRPWWRRPLLVGFLLLLAPFQARPADAQREVHGHSDVFAAEGVMIAWGVLRGATEEATSIVLRVAADPGLYARIAADGVDPFTGGRKAVLPERPLAGLPDVRIPRPHFADFPRTELRFVAAGAAPVLVVFYLGVPDTTPEFANEAGLNAHLADRIARLAASRSKTP